MIKEKGDEVHSLGQVVEFVGRRWYPRGNVIKVSDDLLLGEDGDTFDSLRNKIKKAGKKPVKK